MIAQQTSSSWQGEWGAFAPIAGTPSPTYSGAGLSISGCVDRTCSASVQIDANGGGPGSLQIHSESDAVLVLKSAGNYRCSLHLEKTGSTPASITMRAPDPGCSNFLIAGQSFDHRLVFHSSTVFYGTNKAACYTDPGPGRRALCGSDALSKLRDQWFTLTMDVRPMLPKGATADDDDRKLLAQCDAAPSPADCLGEAFRSGVAADEQIKNAWLAQRSTPGDPSEARAKIAQLAGSYRHTFQNGDVTGDTFSSTDTLEIHRVSDSSVRYKLYLEFYNGHQCSREGTATYEQSGSFVDHTSAESVTNHKGDQCVFELIPTGKGIQLGDATGMCRSTDCGARGGYNGTSFSNAEKVSGNR